MMSLSFKHFEEWTTVSARRHGASLHARSVHVVCGICLAPSYGAIDPDVARV